MKMMIWKSLLSFTQKTEKKFALNALLLSKNLPPINSLLKINTISSEYNYDKRNYEKI